MAEKQPLKFKVVPHIVEDLGLNLYTMLPCVLVEYVANAYDADAPSAAIRLSRDPPEGRRDIVRGGRPARGLRRLGRLCLPGRRMGLFPPLSARWAGWSLRCHQ